MNNAIRKTRLLDIEPGQWVLAFDQPYGPAFREMPLHLEGFASRGGGWDSCRASEIFLVHQVVRVMPKSYTAKGGRHRHVQDGDRLERYTVIAVGSSREQMIELRDRLYAIGADSSDRIETEMYRRIAKFAARERAKATDKIHRLLPQFFRGAA